MVNTKEIRALMILNDVKYQDLAELLGLTPTSVRHKIFNERPMSLAEANIIQKALKVEDSDFAKIFLVEKSRDATND